VWGYWLPTPSLHSPVSPSLPLPCVTVCYQVSIALYISTDCMEIWRFSVDCEERENIWSEQLYVITSIMVAVYRYLSFWRLFVPDEPHDHSLKFCTINCSSSLQNNNKRLPLRNARVSTVVLTSLVWRGLKFWGVYQAKIVEHASAISGEHFCLRNCEEWDNGQEMISFNTTVKRPLWQSKT